MKYCCTILMALILFMGRTQTKEKTNEIDPSQFASEMQQLKDYFHIPGLAILVQKGDSIWYEDYMGHADVEQKIKVDSATAFPIASITKVFAATALLKLAEEGKVSLDMPIDPFLENASFGDSIQVQHVLSHTSQGEVGKHFYYSYRFGTLTPVIAKASNSIFEDYIRNSLFEPLGLRATYILTDSSSVRPKMALPYNFEGQVVPGLVEFGSSASAGIVSTARDMAKFSQAMDQNTLLSSASKTMMYTPFAPSSPYGLGIFSQNIMNKRVVWAYGQYDSYSSLLLKIPEEELTLVLLANSNLMSDPARLINGDVAASLFALSFLKHFVFTEEALTLFEPTNTKPKSTSELHRRKLLAKALAASFMARYDDAELEKSKQLLRLVFETYPEYLRYAHLNLLHTVTFIKSVHFHKELGPFEEFDPQIEAIATQLLTKDPNNPYVHVYMGLYYDRKGNMEKARVHFENIAKAQNFSPFWYTAEAKNWLVQQEE